MRRSTSTSRGAVRGTSAMSGISALRPLPRAGRFSMCDLSCPDARRARNNGGWTALSCGGQRRAFEHFTREREVRRRAARFHVVENDRHAMARRFAEPDVARDDGPEHLVLEEFPDIGGDLLSEIRPI